jgi:hypothetical protein
MDLAVTEFLGVEKKCTYFQDADFTKLHFDRGDNPMIEFFREWTCEDRVITKLSSITLSKFLTTFLSNWNDEIIKYLNKRGDQINSTYDITIQQLASYYGHTGGKGNLGKMKTEEHRANISAGKVRKKNKPKTKEHLANISAAKLAKSGKNSAVRAQSERDKWFVNLSKVKTFIAEEGRKPKENSSDAGERSLANWINHSKRNNEREQLMRREIPIVFEVDGWRDVLEKVMMFIATEGRKPIEQSSDANEKKLANWINNNKRKEKGTNSERDQMMRRDIPSVFINAKPVPPKRK